MITAITLFLINKIETIPEGLMWFIVLIIFIAFLQDVKLLVGG